MRFGQRRKLLYIAYWKHVWIANTGGHTCIIFLCQTTASPASIPARLTLQAHPCLTCELCCAFSILKWKRWGADTTVMYCNTIHGTANFAALLRSQWNCRSLLALREPGNGGWMLLQVATSTWAYGYRNLLYMIPYTCRSKSATRTYRIQCRLVRGT